ncbi:nuclear fragile X mental retardation-interacting protein 2 isoform X2 [Scleropages formosus]|uniref:nuclear fragile X mental retardation-interacting protein 2 isoform X2 n=1 Tax=Scleropages formosus TaxID=113540 RepID=UPI0010FA92B1|nr:nuclear fragile X mental retardation-interacting protein 2 isoform X2 [Scleropages formosus]
MEEPPGERPCEQQRERRQQQQEEQHERRQQQQQQQQQQRRRRRHGEEKRSPGGARKALKNDQDTETQTKKTGNGRVNGNTTERKKILPDFDSVSIPYSINGHGCRQLDATSRLKQSGKVPAGLSKEGCKSSCSNKNSMDIKNDKSFDFKSHEGKKELVALLNGVVAPSGRLTNGYPSKSAADNDGSGSESGCGTPKKRRPQRAGSKCADNVPQDKATRQGLAELPKREPELVERTVGSQANCARAPSRAEAPALTRAKPALGSASSSPQTGELARKNSDGKAAGTTGKKYEDRPGKAKISASVTAKDDSWTLFKPPPVFPVDNSSAKIVPKISYASKVKENLNKVSQVSVDAPNPPACGTASQVPLSAVKTITSSSFSNGPVSGEENGGPLYTAACTLPLASSVLGGENVASCPESAASIAAVPSASVGSEQRKPNLFVYPLGTSNMQPPLPSGCQADPPLSAPSNQKALGDIFQNQWGLSFINEPSAGPEGAIGQLAVSGHVTEVNFQSGYSAAPVPQAPAALPHGPAHPPLPKAYDPDMRTSHQTLSVLKTCPPSALACEGWTQTQPLDLDAQEATAASLGAIVFNSFKDPGHEASQANPASAVVALPKEAGHPRGLDRRSDWGPFDLRAAVIYHTKEMEYVLNLQKQVIYQVFVAV